MTGRPASATSGWKRLGVVLSTAWGLGCLVAAGGSLVGWYAGKSPHPFNPLDVASMALALLLFVVIPAAAMLGAGRFFRVTAGYQGKLRDLSIPRAAWVVVAFFLAYSFLLPGWLGLALALHGAAAQAMNAWQIMGKPMPDSSVTAFVFLPQWVAYTLGSWVLMRIVDWIWRGFNQPGKTSTQ